MTIEATLERIAVALEKIAQLQVGAETAEAPAKAPGRPRKAAVEAPAPAAATPAPAAVATPAAPATPPPTVVPAAGGSPTPIGPSDINTAAAELTKLVQSPSRGGKAAGMAVLAEFKVGKLSELPAAKLGEFIKACIAKGVEPAATADPTGGLLG